MLHGGNFYGFTEDIKKELLDFSANISPLGMPDSVKQAIEDEMANALHYPDPVSGRLSKAIGKKMNIDPSWVICGNGAADIVYRFVYGLKPEKAVVIHPTFVEYEEAMRCIETEIISYDLCRKDFKIREDILDLINNDIDAVFICNPNNPTGVLTEKSLLLEIAAKTAQCGAWLVLDECFLDFTGREDELSLVHELQGNDRLLILKSFTKMYAIPGIRLGFGLCSNPEAIEKMRRAGQSWAVSTLAESAGIALLDEDEYCTKVISYVDRERKFLETELEKIGVEYIHGNANYMLIHCPGVTDLYERLLKEKVMIRTCGNYKNLDTDYYRIAINDHESNKAMIERMKKVLV